MTSRPFRVLLVPVLLALVAGASAPGWIRVRRGDTLSELARRYHTSVEALRALNKLPGNNLIFEGQQLRVGVIPAVPKPKPVPPAFRRIEVSYVVRDGDGVYRIATRYHAKPQWIVQRNHLPKSMVIHPGQRLVVGSVVVRVQPPKPKAPPHVPKAYVRQLVIREAKRAGLDPALALAVSYNESGWQQHVVSNVGAIGVMQVMPRTGEWVSRYLVGRSLDLRDVEDNVIAGTRYLALLTRITGSKHVDLAVAGYYQGLTSVKKKGMYDDTKAYVANILALRRRFAR
jgi:soluble lytic murein transglycosylase-like protein